MGYQLVTRPELKKVADLKGKRFGISRFSSASEFGVQSTAQKSRQSIQKMLPSCKSATRRNGSRRLRSGSIDGSVFNAPFGAMAKKFDFNILADAVALGIPYFNTGIAGSAKAIADETKRRC